MGAPSLVQLVARRAPSVKTTSSILASDIAARPETCSAGRSFVNAKIPERKTKSVPDSRQIRTNKTNRGITSSGPRGHCANPENNPVRYGGKAKESLTLEPKGAYHL